jgi:hypothetical protein
VLCDETLLRSRGELPALQGTQVAILSCRIAFELVGSSVARISLVQRSDRLRTYCVRVQQISADNLTGPHAMVATGMIYTVQSNRQTVLSGKSWPDTLVVLSH